MADDKGKIRIPANAVDNKKLNDIIRDLKTVMDKLDGLSAASEVFYVSRLEDLCSRLKSGIIAFTLDIPPLASFERYLSRLEDISDLVYIIGLLHECWIYVHPDHLFDRSLKADISQEDMLHTALSRLRSGRNNSYDFVKEYDRHNITGLTILYYKAYEKQSSQVKYCYQNYMDGLFEICSTVCSKYGIPLSPDKAFLINTSLCSNLTHQQIDSVFSVVAGTNRLKQEDRKAFNSFFSSSLFAAEKSVMWIDVAKSGTPNFYSLYVLLTTMGVSMTEFNKQEICRVFYTAKGAIKPEQLKSRAGNNQSGGDSAEMVKFREQIVNAIAQPLSTTAIDDAAQKTPPEEMS